MEGLPLLRGHGADGGRALSPQEFERIKRLAETARRDAERAAGATEQLLDGLFAVGAAELRQAHEAPLPALFG